MNIKAVIPLIAGLCIGGFALKIGLDTLQKAKAAPTETVPVWAAKVDVPRGIAVTDEMIMSIEFPAKLVSQGAMTDKEALIGRVPRVDAPAGLPILDEMLLAPGEFPGVYVPPGYRAVAVKIDESSGVDFHLEPGCRVDVVGFLTARRGSRQEKLARTILENVGVAAVGPRLSAVDSESGGKAARPTRAVTLLVKPDQVPVLHLAEQQGKLKLSMRNSDDGQTLGHTRSVTFEELLDPSLAAAHGDEPEPKLTSEEPTTSGGLLSWLGLSGQPKQPDTPPAKEPETPPCQVVAAEQIQPPVEPEWVVCVWRGDKLEVVRYKNRNSRERVVQQPQQNRGASSRGRPTSAARHVPAPTPQPQATSTPSAQSSARAPSVRSDDDEEEKQEQDQEPSE